MTGEVGLVSGRVRRGQDVFRGLLRVVTFTAKSAYCRDVFNDVGLMSVRVRRNNLLVGTCTAT